MKAQNLIWKNRDLEVPIKEFFSARLETLIQESNISKRALAKELGLSSVIITKYTQGATMPSVDVLTSLADYFNVSIDFLLGRTKQSQVQDDRVYLKPIAKIPYFFRLSNDVVLEGELEYIFGLTVWNSNYSENINALNQFLCLKFANNAANQELYDSLFLTDELNVRYFLENIFNKLGLPFVDPYNQILPNECQYLANLLIWNEVGIKPPIGEVQLIAPQYLASLEVPLVNEPVRLKHTYTSPAMPHLQSWLAMNENERQVLLRNYLKIKKIK